MSYDSSHASGMFMATGAAPVRSPNFISARYQVTPEDAGLAEMVPSDEVQSSHIFNLRSAILDDLFPAASYSL